MPDPAGYRATLERGRRIHAPTRVGRPGRSRGYWPLFVPAQALRLRYAVHVTGREHVLPGPAILIGNHLSLMDPVLVGVTTPWRLCFFTKVEAYEGAGGFFFRWAGQIPLRRGDEESTAWALEMSQLALESGAKLCVYPEGTRSPDGRSLHRLHRRVLVPILQANPGVPVHAMTVRYGTARRGRIPVDLRFSPALRLAPDASGPDALTDSVRDALLELGGMPYVHAFGRAVKSGD